MNPDYQSKEDELRQKEAELREREIYVRMRELESEIETKTPSKPAVQRQNPLSLVTRLPKVVQLVLLVVGVILAIRVATVLAGVFILFVIGWVGYKLFLERDRT